MRERQFTAEEIAAAINAEDRAEAVFKILEHASGESRPRGEEDSPGSGRIRIEVYNGRTKKSRHHRSGEEAETATI